MNFLLKRSDVPGKRPNAADLVTGELVMNFSSETPSLWWKAAGQVVGCGPVTMGDDPPNSTPPPGGSAGNYPGELWYDTGTDPTNPILKVFDGTNWLASYGNPLNGYTDAAKNNMFVGANYSTPATGTNNTTFGLLSASGITSGSENTLVGYKAGQNLTNNSRCTVLGTDALAGSSPTGSDAIAIGFEALGFATSISNCIAIGNGSLKANTGSGNTAIGHLALQANTTGSNNIAIGYAALSVNTTGSNNIAIGENTLLNADPAVSDNICFGAYAGQYLKAGSSGNIFLGPATGPGQNVSTSVSNSVYIGAGAGQLAQGDNNCVIGRALTGTGTPLLMNDTCIVGFLDLSNITAVPDLFPTPLNGYTIIGAGGVPGIYFNSNGAVGFGLYGFGEPGMPLYTEGPGVNKGTKWFNGPTGTFTSSDNKKVTVKYGLVTAITPL